MVNLCGWNNKRPIVYLIATGAGLKGGDRHTRVWRKSCHCSTWPDLCIQYNQLWRTPSVSAARGHLQHRLQPLGWHKSRGPVGLDWWQKLVSGRDVVPLDGGGWEAGGRGTGGVKIQGNNYGMTSSRCKWLYGVTVRACFLKLIL